MDLIGISFVLYAIAILLFFPFNLTDVIWCRGWKHSFALRCLWGKFEMLSGKNCFRLKLCMILIYLPALYFESYNNVFFFRSSLQGVQVGRLWIATGNLFAKGILVQTLTCFVTYQFDLFFFASSPRWLPLDIARMWGRHWLEPLLAPSSDAVTPAFPHSNYLSLPLMSVLNIARYFVIHNVCFCEST
jgi:hypothetical protein